MSRRAVFLPYQPKKILNKGKRPDHWFWTRYSAYPYIGCQHGCAFCYCRERKYCPYDDPGDFSYIIKVKENAPELLRRELRKVPTDLVFTGDYQPAERKFQISRRMLEVCYDLGFPVFVLERSPLVLRDLDLLLEIEQRARAVVAFSLISTPDSPHYERIRQMENLAPPAEKRFAAMEKIASSGILTGVCCMPVLPGLCDDETNLENIVRWTADHGGKFVLAGGLTLADQQRVYFFDLLALQFPDLLNLYQTLYPEGSYSAGQKQVARRVHELCDRYGIHDRLPRPIIPGDKFTLNKKIVEKLASQVYLLEIQSSPAFKIWAYRKAAWAIEDLQMDIGLLYRSMGTKGLQSIPGIGHSIGLELEQIILTLAR